jgi:phosphatidate cytidylyltransferase
MLRWRLLSAGVILCLLLTLVVLDFQLGAPPGVFLLPLLLLITALGTEECLSLLAAKELRPVQWPVYAGSLGVALAFGWPVLTTIRQALEPGLESGRLAEGSVSLPLLALAVGVILVLVAEMWQFNASGQHIVHIALAVFVIVYVGVLGGFMTALRLERHDNGVGMVALLSMLVVVKTSDSAAYGFGRIFGRTKMTPRLSPGKTVEGACGGIAAGCLASWAFFYFAAPQLVSTQSGWSPPPWPATLLYGAILSIAAMIGDLAESLLKRDMQRKDSSTWLPGLGGVLDIMDSLLVGGPAAYLCWELGLV